jgi:hypothetical protein
MTEPELKRMVRAIDWPQVMVGAHQSDPRLGVELRNRIKEKWSLEDLVLRGLSQPYFRWYYQKHPLPEEDVRHLASSFPFRPLNAAEMVRTAIDLCGGPHAAATDEVREVMRKRWGTDVASHRIEMYKKELLSANGNGKRNKEDAVALKGLVQKAGGPSELIAWVKELT